MKLTNIRGGRTADSTMELIVELDGSYYEAIRFDPNTDAADVVARLHGLADRILRRAASSQQASMARRPTAKTGDGGSMIVKEQVLTLLDAALKAARPYHMDEEQIRYQFRRLLRETSVAAAGMQEKRNG